MKTISNLDLKPNPQNPRKISDEKLKALAKSLHTFGDLSSIVFNVKTGKLVGGHQRIKAIGDFKIQPVTEQVKDKQGTVGNGFIEFGKDSKLNIRFVEWDEKRELAAMIAANKHGGEFTIPELKDILIELDTGDFEMDLTGFLGDELEEIMTAVKGEEKGALDEKFDEMPPLKINCGSKLGDLYEFTSEDEKRCHRLLCGDSTKKEDVDKLLNEQKPILMVTDPPYGVKYDSSWREGYGNFKGKRNTGKVLNDDIVDWSEAYKLFDCDIAYVWHASLFTEKVFRSIEESGYSLISNIIWAKQHFALSRGDYHWMHETCWYGVKTGKNHNWQGARDQATIWNIKNNNPTGNSEKEEQWGHSTQKPIECMARPIRNNSAEGELICDPFLGSGTTLIAAEALKRPCYGMELHPHYCDIIVNRFISMFPKATVLKNGEPFKPKEQKSGI